MNARFRSLATPRERRVLRVLSALGLSLGLLACSGDSSTPNTAPRASGASAVTEKAGTAPVFRFAKISNGAYFYTGSTAERDLILRSYPDFRYEGVAFLAVTDGTGKPVYRFANLSNGGYFFTGSAAERDLVIRDYPNMRYEGSTFSVAADSVSDALPVLRLANLSNGAYLFTTNRSECEYALSLGNWRYEGSTFKVPGDTPYVDPFTPPAPVSLASAASTYGIEAEGVGGDASGDTAAAGIAGDGAPIRKAVVILTDSQGNVVKGFTDSKGKFLLKFKNATMRPPFVLKVLDGGGRILSSAITNGIGGGSTVWAHINPLTDKVVSDALPVDVPGTDKTFNGAKIDPAKVAAAKRDVVASVDPALSSLCIADTSRLDPIHSPYAYDGKGVDAVLESVDHTREPATGSTQLRAKLNTIANNSVGTELPSLVSSEKPLSKTQIAAQSSPALNFEKLDAWVKELNRCLALGSGYARDPDCVDADGSRLVSTSYRANGADFQEDLRRIFSEADGSPVAGTTIRNPVVLFYERATGGAVEERATVEVTVLQPRIGPRGPDGEVVGAVEYTRILVFRRDDRLSRAKARNWIAYGDQRRYSLSVRPRYFFFNQSNPAQMANISPQRPSFIKSSLHFFIERRRYDPVSRSRVDANIRVVRVTGPGLPAAGVVFAPSSVCGSSGYLTIFDKRGTIPPQAIVTGSPFVDFRLASVTASGAPHYAASVDYTNNPEEAYPQITDFSPLRAYSLYRFEIFLNSNTSGTADAVEFARTYAPVLAPAKLVNLPRNGLEPSADLVTAPAPGVPAGGSVSIRWTNTVDAAPVEVVAVYAIPASGGRFNVSAVVPGAYSVDVRPLEQSLRIPTAQQDPNCAAGLPALGTGLTGGYREVYLRSTQGRSLVYTDRAWTNP